MPLKAKDFLIKQKGDATEHVSAGGIMVSIAAFQAVDPGSIPGQRRKLFFTTVLKMAKYSGFRFCLIEQNEYNYFKLLSSNHFWLHMLMEFSKPLINLAKSIN